MYKELRDRIEDSSIPNSEKDEFFSLLDDEENKIQDDSESESKIKGLEEKLADEKDWRKKASLSAQIISEKIDSSKYYS